MDNYVVAMAVIVLVVVAVGFITVMPTPMSGMSLTGDVIASTVRSDDCSRCTGGPVCAAKGDKVFNYDSACLARCDDARILWDYYCESVPKAK